MNEPIIDVRSVGLAYRLMRYHIATVHELAVRMLKRQVRFETLWALHDVSFTVARGEAVAVVGPNGAGKTTLMKVVGRVLPPTRGRVIVRGHTASLIELGAGFQPDLSGYENILLYGTILGHDPRELRRVAPALAEWAGLEDFLDVPLRSYSSGMRARLGFAVASYGAPELLLIDEALSVGDEAFRRRSRARIEELVARGTALLVVSHEVRILHEVTERAIWLDHGRIVDVGPTTDVIAAYTSSVVEPDPSDRVSRSRPATPGAAGGATDALGGQRPTDTATA